MDSRVLPISTMISRVLSTVLLPVVWTLAAAEDTETTRLPVTSNSNNPSIINPTVANRTAIRPGGPLRDLDSSMIQRALYVLIGITAIGVLYFLVRAVRLKKPSQRKKYGLLKNYDEGVEMDAVESDEDETLYEARSLRS